MAPFTGYPFAALWSNNDSNLDQQAQAHNQVELACNELQAQVTSLEAALESYGSITAAINEFFSSLEAYVSYTPTLYNITSLGASPGEAWGRYVRLGNLVFLEAGFRLGTGFSMSASSPFGVGLPFVANLDPTKVRRPAFTAYANNASSSQRTSGTGVILSTENNRVSRFANEATGLGWDGGSPYTWQSGDDLVLSGHYWAVPDGG